MLSDEVFAQLCTCSFPAPTLPQSCGPWNISGSSCLHALAHAVPTYRNVFPSAVSRPESPRLSNSAQVLCYFLGKVALLFSFHVLHLPILVKIRQLNHVFVLLSVAPTHFHPCVPHPDCLQCNGHPSQLLQGALCLSMVLG